MTKKISTVFVFLVFPVSISAMEMPHMHSEKMGEKPHSAHHSNLTGVASESAQMYAHANHQMHEGMNIIFSGNADLDFVRGMIPHHRGAVEMAKIQLKYGQNGSLKHLTQQIIRDQNREIRSMQRWLERLEKEFEMGELQSERNFSTRDFRAANRKMHRKMNISYSGNADIDFVNGMIPHHRGAVEMAKIVLQHGRDPSIKMLASEIINAQESEITWMKTWKRQKNLRQIGG